MTTHLPRRIAATVAAASVVLAGGVALAPAAAAAPTGSDLDYFSYAYPGLRDDSVFEAVTLERFAYLLGSEGTFAFLIGGPADPTTTAAVSHIDAVAQQYGVDKIYAFDPRLDGEQIDIRTTALAELAAPWTALVGTHLNKDATPQFGGEPGDDPYLFIYDKDHQAGETEDRIIASLGGAVDAASVASPAGAAAYREQVAGVFDAIAVEGVAEVDTQSHFAFYKKEVNRKHREQFPDAAKYGAEILSDADGADFAIRQVSYPELLQVLESEGDHVILFGGTWCHNTRAVIKDVNRAAAAAGVHTVYQFDLRLDGSSGNDLHIRDTNSEIAYLYGDVVSQFFPNLRTQYRVEAGGGQKVDYYPGGDKSIAVASAKKLQVPYLIEYNKADEAAPIVQDWIRDNGDGTFTEYMTEWWWVAGLPGNRPNNVSEENWPARQAQNWAFADEAIAKIDGFFGLATAPAVPEVPSVIVDGADATVTWIAPADGGSALTGYRLTVDGGTPIEVPATTTSHELTGLVGGEHTVTISAVNHLGASAASAAKSFSITHPPVEPDLEPTVSVAGQLRPGGSIIVTGAGLPASTPDVTVEIRSTPQTLGTVSTSADGTFRLDTTIPASVAPGAHTVVVLIDGEIVASQAITVAAAGGGSAASAGSTDLAATGGDGIPFALIGGAIALVLAGVSLTVVRRRRSVV